LAGKFTRVNAGLIDGIPLEFPNCRDEAGRQAEVRIWTRADGFNAKTQRRWEISRRH